MVSIWTWGSAKNSYRKGTLWVVPDTVNAKNRCRGLCLHIQRHLRGGTSLLLSRQNVLVLLMFILLIVKLFVAVYLLVMALITLFFIYGLFKHQLTRFECGFSGVGAVLKLSLNFFSILIVFIIFDLEIILLIGMITKDFYRTWGLLLVWGFIFLGLYFEWWAGKLSWFV